MRRAGLVAARKAVGKNQEEVAELVGVDRTTVGTWERGTYTPHPNQRPAYADAIGLTLDELAVILGGLPDTVGEPPDWLVNFLASEQSASTLRAHEPRVVYGLLQTSAYAEALVGRVGDVDAPASHVRRLVEQRRHRQKRVRDGGVELHVVQPESALRQMIGGAEVMAKQLDTMIELAAQPNVTIQITRYDVGQYEARRLGDFTVTTHPWGSPRVYIEEYAGGHFISAAEEVGHFISAFDYACRIALSPRDSVSFMGSLADDWRSNA